MTGWWDGWFLLEQRTIWRNIKRLMSGYMEQVESADSQREIQRRGGGGVLWIFGMSVKFYHASLCSAAHKSSLMNVLCHRRTLTVSSCHWLPFYQRPSPLAVKVLQPPQVKLKAVTPVRPTCFHRNYLKRFRKSELKSKGWYFWISFLQFISLFVSFYSSW